MANELQADHVTGLSVYFLVRNPIGQAYNTVTPAFETYVTANLGNYAIAATEQGTASGYYAANMPANMPAGLYYVLAKVRAGGSPAESDVSIGGETLFWAGSEAGLALDPAGLDPILLEQAIAASTSLINDSGTQLTAVNARQGLALLISSICAVLSGAASTLVQTRPVGKPAGAVRIAATVDSSDNRTAMVLRVPN